MPTAKEFKESFIKGNIEILNQVGNTFDIKIDKIEIVLELGNVVVNLYSKGVRICYFDKINAKNGDTITLAGLDLTLKVTLE